MTSLRSTVLTICVLITACTSAPTPPPPPNRIFDGLPVTGSRAFAERTGFTVCVETSSAVRCRKDGVMLFGTGPYKAAVDLGRDGSAGFHQLTLWHDRDQHVVYAVGRHLREQGWDLCRTGWENRGDQEIWRKPGARIRVMVDLSYWSKRRVRVLPELGQPTGRCW